MVFTMGTENLHEIEGRLTVPEITTTGSRKSKWPIRLVFRFHLFNLKLFSYQIRFGFVTNSSSGWRKRSGTKLARAELFLFFSFFFLLFFHRVDA